MFEARLESLAQRIGSVEALALVARDGIAVESWPAETGLDLEALAAELLTPVRAFTGDSLEDKMGTVRQFAVTTDRRTLMLSAVSESYYLLLVLGAAGNVGRARFELRRAELDFGSDLI